MQVWDSYEEGLAEERAGRRMLLIAAAVSTLIVIGVVVWVVVGLGGAA